ncbi:MAG: hypothetical protein HY364_00535 [Candidatus Aenigmarchaeota archaeon]|nr:hypothetical protein [Candidatus Aenigmarchaeota archaeon]
MKYFAILLAVLSMSGCIQAEEPLVLIRVPGHADVYRFSYDVRETVNIDSQNAHDTRNALLGAESISFVINATNETTIPGYYSKSVVNIVQKLKTYQLYSGKILNNYSVFVYDNQKHMWLNSTSGEIEPSFGDAVIWMESNAGRTSVDFENGIIYVRGDNYENMVRASDKLALIFMNVDSSTISEK